MQYAGDDRTLNDRGIPAYSESKGSGEYVIYMEHQCSEMTSYVNEKDADRSKEIVKALTLPLEEKTDQSGWDTCPVVR